MLCNKIYENPRKKFFTIAGSGDEQNQKANIFSNSTSLKLSLALCHRILLSPVFWATLVYIFIGVTADNILRQLGKT